MYIIIPITDEQIIFTTAIPNRSGRHRSMCTTTPTYIYKYVALIVIIFVSSAFVYVSVEIELCVVLVITAVRTPVKEKVIEPHTRRPYSVVKVVEASAVCRPQQPASIEAYIYRYRRQGIGGQTSTKGTFRRVGHTHTHSILFVIIS